MRIATVTLTPALDQTVRVDNFRTNTVNYGQEMQFSAGGKGVNVASFLADAGFATTVTGFLGQDNADIFEQAFADKQIEDQFVRIPGRTRIGVKIVDEVKQQTTDINMRGLTPPPRAMDALQQKLKQLASYCDWFVLSGRLPPGVPTTTYALLINQLKAYGKPVVLDTSNEALREGIQAGPTIIKPNVDELSQLIGKTLTDNDAIEQAARQLLHKGIQFIIVSMGERGAMFIDQASTLIAVPPHVQVKSTVGAGDALVAGFIAGQIRGLDLIACTQLATAFSLGAITQTGSRLPDHEILQTYSQQVTVYPFTSVPHSA
jgi:1-phosphofructokinase